MSTAIPTRPIFRLALLPLLVGAALAVTASCRPSSHREAPFIATQPQLDGTDFYMFRSYEPGREGYVTLVADYLPLQAPYGGPNYFKLDPNAIYEIHVTNNGGAVENVTFQFRFQNTLDDNQFTVGGKKVSIPLAQNGSGDVATPGSDALNVHETYTLVRLLRRPRRDDSRGRDATSPRAARRSTSRSTTSAPRPSSNYVAYANKHICEIAVPGCSGTGRVFVGPAQGPVPREPRRDVRPGQHQVPGGRIAGGRRVRDRRFAARLQRDRAGARVADRLPDPGQGRHHRRLDDLQRARHSLAPRRHRAAVSIPRRKSATSFRCPAWARRWSTKWSSA